MNSEQINEIASAYLDGELTADETVLLAQDIELKTAVAKQAEQFANLGDRFVESFERSTANVSTSVRIVSSETRERQIALSVEALSTVEPVLEESIAPGPASSQTSETKTSRFNKAMLTMAASGIFLLLGGLALANRSSSESFVTAADSVESLEQISADETAPEVRAVAAGQGSTEGKASSDNARASTSPVDPSAMPDQAPTQAQQENQKVEAFSYTGAELVFDSVPPNLELLAAEVESAIGPIEFSVCGFEALRAEGLVDGQDQVFGFVPALVANEPSEVFVFDNLKGEKTSAVARVSDCQILS